MNMLFESPLKQLKSVLQPGEISPNKAAEQLLRSCIDHLNIQRASIWLSTDDDLLSCQMLLDRTEGMTQEPLLLDRWSFPNYFQALDKKGIICAVDAYNDPATRDLYDTFLKPAKIRSLLDIPLLNGGKLTGIICCEHTQVIKHWTIDEITFVSELANIYKATFDMH